MSSASLAAEHEPVTFAAARPPASAASPIDVVTPAALARHIASACDPAHASGYRPVLLRLHRCADAAALCHTLKDIAGLEIHDHIELQLRELVTQRAPGRKLTQAQASAAMAEVLGPRTALEYGVWVFYPWSRRLVHVLEREHFIDVRTNRNLYKITPAERDALGTKRMGVIGLSVGQSVALTLAMERSFGFLRLADFDRLELSNLNRLRGGLHNLGQLKVHIAAREIAELDPFLEVECIEQGVNEDNIDPFLTAGGKLDALVEECDSIDIKFLARERARAHRIPVLMDTSDRGMFDLERFDIEPARPLFHGLAGDVDHRALRAFTYEQKIPFVVSLMGEGQMSSRLRASMLEIDQTLTSWPQLGSAVTLGGAMVADVCRRLLLGNDIPSGRHYIDFDAIIATRPVDRTGIALEPVPAVRDPWPRGEDLLRSLDHGLPGADELPRDTVTALVEAGNAAPSGGNVQPWRWLHAGRHLFLLRDATRASPWLAVGGLADHLALGAAAENVVLAAHALGLQVRLQQAQPGGDAGFVCAFAFHRQKHPGVMLEPHDFDALASAIHQRCTNREIRPRQPLPTAAHDAILSAAQSLPGVRLRLLTRDEDLDAARDVICEATRSQFLQRDFHRGMMDEIRWSSAEAELTRDGIDLPSLALSKVDDAGLRLCRDWEVIDHLRIWRLGQGLARLPRRAIDGASAVGLLCVSGWRPELFFQAGRAMQRLWLTATASGVGLQPWSVLPYLFARRRLLAGEGLEPFLLDTLSRLWEPYSRLFDLDQDEGQALLFRLCAAPETPIRSLRRETRKVLRFADL